MPAPGWRRRLGPCRLHVMRHPDASESPGPTGTAMAGLRPTVQRDERTATLALLRWGLVSPKRLVSLVDVAGSAVPIAIDALDGALLDARGRPLAALSREAIDRAVNEVDEIERRGWFLHAFTDPTYPGSLRGIYNCPPLLWAEGVDTEVRAPRCVAIVGSRAASPDGVKRARKLARRVAEAGFTVASGLARGIDAAAHEGALDVRGRTIAVMGTGLEHRYPSEHAELASRIVRAGGALVSQFLPEQGPRPWTFPERNITMSGLSLATVVVEAGEKSGAKLQAEAALKHGRPVFLPASLVAMHAWASHMVHEGQGGVRAIEAASPDAVIDMLQQAQPADTGPVFV